MKALLITHLQLLLFGLFNMPVIEAASLLAGQRVLVTGAGRGIGAALAQICHREGAQVAITARTKAELEETAAGVCTTDGTNGTKMLILPNCDVTKEDQVEAMVQRVMKKWGGLDILINNAGGAAVKGSVSSLKAKDLRHILNVNVVSVHIVTSTVLRHCSSESPLKHIINVSSRAAKKGYSEMSFYVTSKFALEGYTASLAEELRPEGTLVNSISPGMVNTASFPKAPGRKGVRTAESVRDGLLVLLQQTEVTGHYLHVDELDQVRAKGLPDSKALKPINEPKFSP